MLICSNIVKKIQILHVCSTMWHLVYYNNIHRVSQKITTLKNIHFFSITFLKKYFWLKIPPIDLSSNSASIGDTFVQCTQVFQDLHWIMISLLQYVWWSITIVNRWENRRQKLKSLWKIHKNQFMENFFILHHMRRD